LFAFLLLSVFCNLRTSQVVAAFLAAFVNGHNTGNPQHSSNNNRRQSARSTDYSNQPAKRTSDRLTPTTTTAESLHWEKSGQQILSLIKVGYQHFVGLQSDGNPILRIFLHIIRKLNFD